MFTHSFSKKLLGTIILLACFMIVCGVVHAKGSVVQLTKTDDGYQIVRDGKPYFIKGAGLITGQETDASYMDQLTKAGGNSFRTWGIDQLSDELLDEANRRGLTIAAGIWLGHPRHGFDYSNPDDLKRQTNQVRKAVEQYKDHPAILLWGLGNEMCAEGADPKIFAHVEELAKMVKAIDAHHPVMTVIAELGPEGNKVKMIHEICPSVDIIGINSYAGIMSVHKRYIQAGGTKPYIITEHGPRGDWEVHKVWGVPAEKSSTEKARHYHDGYQEAVLKHRDIALGAYTFLWGHKQETTATWYGMFLKDGTQLGAVDVMTEFWSAKPPVNRAPLIEELILETDAVIAGDILTANVTASDPDGDTLSYEWHLRPANMDLKDWGDFEEAIASLEEAIIKCDGNSVTVKVPEDKDQQPYRLFAYVRDGKGKAAVHNQVLLVKSKKSSTASDAEPMPLIIYAESASQHYTASGFMGNHGDLQLDETATTNPYKGRTCIKITYSGKSGWAGAVWQSPANNWGQVDGGLNLEKAKKLSFYARGDKGGETVDFLCGLLGKEARYRDTTKLKQSYKLTTKWQHYSFNLENHDLSSMISGFGITVEGQGSPITFYLDNIRYE